MSAQNRMDLIHEPQRELEILVATGGVVEAEIVTDGEGVGPEVASRRLVRGEPRPISVLVHQPSRQLGS